MQVHSINLHNTKPSFTGIYRTGEKFSDKQEAVLANITSSMRESLPQFDGQNAEQFYKSSKNYDFVIEPAQNDALLVRGFKNLRHRGVGVSKNAYADEVFTVGTFDLNHPLYVDDINTSLKEAKKESVLTTVTMLILGLCMALIAAHEPIMRAINKNKAPVEVVDTISGGIKGLDVLK